MPLGGDRDTSGQKGYGLSLMVEFLCSQLSASLWSRDVTGSRVDKIVPSDTSHAFIAIDIAAFRDLASTPPAPTRCWRACAHRHRPPVTSA